MNKQKRKQHLLEVGTAYVIEHGYHYSGLYEILAAANMPKGTFYNYFDSKEDFGLQILTFFAENNEQLLRQFLDDESVPPLERLRRYFEYNVDYLASCGFHRGCLIGNLGQEMSDLTEGMRQHVDLLMSRWAALISTCLQQAQQQGQIAPDRDPQELGTFCLNCWQGSLLRMKVAKDAQPLWAFIHLFFDVILR